VGDGVPPVNQLLELGLPLLVPGVIISHLSPKADAEKPEVGAETAWLCIPAVELATLGEPRLHKVPHQGRRIYESDQRSHALRVKIPAKPLKLGGNEHGIGLVDLLGRVSPPRPGPTDGRVSGLDFI
jgi:hypothetical protein